MQIWVDADACPGRIKDMVIRAAERLGVQTTLVANQYLKLRESRYIKAVQVESGMDVADQWIIDQVAPGDLVITADVPLAAQIVRQDAFALNPRGTLYTSENVQNHLAQRNLLTELRSAGMVTGGPPSLGKRDVQAFANQLDKFLTRSLKRP